MPNARSAKTLTLIGAAALALAVGLLARSSVKAPRVAAEEMRDAVAAPISPALLGGARVARPDAGWFASPAGRRAEAERALMSSKLRRAARAVSAQ